MKIKIDEVKISSPDSITLLNNKEQIIMDLRETSPIVEIIDNKEDVTLISKHTVIKLRPKTAKALYNMLEKNIKDYEKKFGKIENPKISKTKKSKKKQSKSKAQTYIG